MFTDNFFSEIEKLADQYGIPDSSKRDLAIGGGSLVAGTAVGGMFGSSSGKAKALPAALKTARGEYKEKLKNVVSSMAERGKLPPQNFTGRLKYLFRGAKSFVK